MRFHCIREFKREIRKLTAYVVTFDFPAMRTFIFKQAWQSHREPSTQWGLEFRNRGYTLIMLRTGYLAYTGVIRYAQAVGRQPSFTVFVFARDVVVFRHRGLLAHLCANGVR